MSEMISMACILLGTLFILIGCIGILKLPDVFCRIHALTKAHTLGLTLLLLGLFLQLDGLQPDYKLLIAILFQFITIPISGHFLALSAYRKKTPRWQAPQP